MFRWPPWHTLSDHIRPGSQFVNELWGRICQLLGIKRRLSTTAYHPETDGQIERTNSTIEAYIHMFCDWAQSNWSILAPMAQLAINGRDSASTGVSPFFLDHGYHVEPLQLEEEAGIFLTLVQCVRRAKILSPNSKERWRLRRQVWQ